MNASGVDKACKSSGFRPTANEVVIHRYSPKSRAYTVERRSNSRWSLRGKDLSLFERPVPHQVVGRVMAYQADDA